MNEVAKFMHYYILYAISRGFQKPFVQCDDTLTRQARAPSRVHITDSQNRRSHTVFLKHRVHFTSLKLSLERATRSLDTLTANAEAQIDGALEAAQRELDSDIGENTMEVEKPKEPAPAQQPGTTPAPEGQQPAPAPAAK